MHCSSQTQNWDKCTARYSPVGGFVRIHRVLSEKSDSVGVIHGFYLGALKLWSPLGSSEFCRILSLTCSWAHCPLCFLDLSFTPLSEHVLRCNFSWMCPTPQWNVCLITLFHPCYRTTIARQSLSMGKLAGGLLQQTADGHKRKQATPS